MRLTVFGGRATSRFSRVVFRCQTEGREFELWKNLTLPLYTVWLCITWFNDTCTTDGIDLTLLHRLRALRVAKKLTLSYSVQLNQDQHFITTKLNHWWTTISPMYIGYLTFYFNERWKLDALRLVCVRLFTQTDFFFLVSQIETRVNISRLID